MKPSEAFDYLNDLHSAGLGAKLRWVALQASYEGLRKQLDDGVAIEIVGESAKNLLAETAIEREDDGPEVSVPFAATMPPAPKLRADGQPRQKPGRKPKAQSNEDRMHQGALPETAVRLPVDQEQNSAEIAVLRRALANGPLTPEELLSVSGLSADAIGAHGRAAAIVEIVDATREAHGRFKAIEEPRLLFRLVSVGAKS